MKNVKRYDAVHIRYEESNIRYGEGCEVEVVAGYDYDALLSERDELLEALVTCRNELGQMIDTNNFKDPIDGSWLYDYQTISEADAIIAKCRGDV